MRLSKNVQSRVVAVLVSLFLGFVMPWVLQANRDFRGEAQFKFDPSAMFASTVAEVLVSIVFAAVFVVSLLYLANQSNSRKLLFVRRCHISSCFCRIHHDLFAFRSWQHRWLDLLRSFPNVSWPNSRSGLCRVSSCLPPSQELVPFEQTVGILRIGWGIAAWRGKIATRNKT